MDRYFAAYIEKRPLHPAFEGVPTSFCCALCRLRDAARHGQTSQVSVYAEKLKHMVLRNELTCTNNFANKLYDWHVNTPVSDDPREDYDKISNTDFARECYLTFGRTTLWELRQETDYEVSTQNRIQFEDMFFAKLKDIILRIGHVDQLYVDLDSHDGQKK